MQILVQLKSAAPVAVVQPELERVVLRTVARQLELGHKLAPAGPRLDVPEYPGAGIDQDAVASARGARAAQLPLLALAGAVQPREVDLASIR